MAGRIREEKWLQTTEHEFTGFSNKKSAKIMYLSVLT